MLWITLSTELCRLILVNLHTLQDDGMMRCGGLEVVLLAIFLRQSPRGERCTPYKPNCFTTNSLRVA